MPTNQQRDLHHDWIVRLRLAIDADDAPEAQAIAGAVLQQMDVMAGTEPQITRSTGRVPYWNIVTDLDLSGLTSITPDDAPTRFRYVIRNLTGITLPAVLATTPIAACGSGYRIAGNWPGSNRNLLIQPSARQEF